MTVRDSRAKRTMMYKRINEGGKIRRGEEGVERRRADRRDRIKVVTHIPEVLPAATKSTALNNVVERLIRQCLNRISLCFVLAFAASPDPTKLQCRFRIRQNEDGFCRTATHMYKDP